MPMRWEDERYVRLYTRKTADWNSWGWDAQALFCQLLMVADRLGVIELGRHGKRGVALAVGHPEERVLPALEVLLADGVVVLSDDKLIIRNFPEAQESRTCDRERKRQQRERDRAALRLVVKEPPDEPSPPVTPRPKKSRGVTGGHKESPRAVPSLAVPCSPVPSQPLPSEAGPPPPVENLLADASARSLKLWGLMQVSRNARHNVLPERKPDGPQLAAMLKPVLDALGEEVAFETYNRFLEDSFAQTRTPCCPIQLFLAQWERHVPPVEPARPPPVTCALCGGDKGGRGHAPVGGLHLCYGGCYGELLMAAEEGKWESSHQHAAEWVRVQRTAEAWVGAAVQRQGGAA